MVRVHLGKNFYTYQYNEKTHNISMILPDSEAFVVEYTYRFKFTSNYAGQTITIKNNVELVGSYKKKSVHSGRIRVLADQLQNIIL